MKIERTGGFEDPYIGYVEVNLCIPQISVYNEDILMLVIQRVGTLRGSAYILEPE